MKNKSEQDWYNMYPDQISKLEERKIITNTLWAHLHVESKKLGEKKAHRYKEQIGGWQRLVVGCGWNWWR